MSTVMHTEIDTFLRRQSPAEVGCIVLSADGAPAVQKALDQAGYHSVHDLEGFLAAAATGRKVSWYFRGHDYKTIYDVVAQYPVGMLEVKEPKSAQIRYLQ